MHVRGPKAQLDTAEKGKRVERVRVDIQSPGRQRQCDEQRRDRAVGNQRPGNERCGTQLSLEREPGRLPGVVPEAKQRPEEIDPDDGPGQSQRDVLQPARQRREIARQVVGLRELVVDVACEEPVEAPADLAEHTDPSGRGRQNDSEPPSTVTGLRQRALGGATRRWRTPATVTTVRHAPWVVAVSTAHPPDSGGRSPSSIAVGSRSHRFVRSRPDSGRGSSPGVRAVSLTPLTAPSANRSRTVR